MISNYVNHEYTSWYRQPVAGDSLKLRLKTDKEVKRVLVYFDSRFKPQPFPAEKKSMNFIGGCKNFNYFQNTIKVEDSRFLYCFKLFARDSQPAWYTEQGFSRSINNLEHNDYFHYPYIGRGKVPEYPEWITGAVVYQIFPERFARGGSGTHKFSLDEWGGKPRRNSFFGGDLQGIIDKFDYLNDLGIEAIYLTPIFKSPSNHKYNIDDYYQIDDNFGDISIAKKLVDKAHDNDIKIIIDGVFNHTGDGFFAFQDLLEKGQDSNYEDWYHINSYPVTKSKVNYETFGTKVRSMPRLNLYNNEAREYFLKVIEYWTENLNIDGWRMDVADEVPEEFWRRTRKLIKEIDPECYLVGEVWYNSAPWLGGEQFDGVMNYRPRQLILDLLANGRISVQEFSARIQKQIFNHPPGSLLRSLNMLDSHDTSRIAHNFRYFPDNKKKKLLKQSIALQFALPGMPLIFYGDEIGLEGGEDPDCRRCMVWDEKLQDRELLNFYQRLISFYRDNPALKSGSYREIKAVDIKQLLVFARVAEFDKCVTFANTSSANIKIRQEFLTNKENIFNKQNNYFSLLGKYYEFNGGEFILPANEVLFVDY